MRILHLAPVGHHPEGISSVLIKLVPEQIRLGHDVRVASIFRNTFIDAVEVLFIESLDYYENLIEEFKPDIVHFHGVYKKEYIKFYRYLLGRQIPYLVQMHGALSEYNYGRSHVKKTIANILFFKSFLKNAKALVFLSENERSRCVATKWNPKALIIPNGCEVVDGLDLNRQPDRITDIVYIGRISYEGKGFGVLLGAIRQLMDEGFTDFRISIYGNPDDRDLPLLIEHYRGVEEFAAYRGGIYGMEKDRRMRHCDCFLLPSKSEGLPMGVLEALSYGVPCILTTGTNMAEIVESSSAGWKCECTPESIKRTIIKAVKEYKANPYSFRNNAQMLSRKYNWPSIAQKAVESYKEVIGS